MKELYTSQYPSIADVVRYDSIHLQVNTQGEADKFVRLATHCGYTKLSSALKYHVNLFVHIYDDLKIDGRRICGGWLIEKVKRNKTIFD